MALRYGAGISIWLEICRQEMKCFPDINILRLWLSFDTYIRYPEETPEEVRFNNF